MNSKKILCSALAMSLVLGSSMPAFAANKSQNSTQYVSKSEIKGKSNFKMDTSDIAQGNIEYTYDQDGSSYKVVEKINKSLDNGSSEIYKLDKNTGNYELISTVKTTVTGKNLEDTKITIATKDLTTGKSDVESTKLSDIIKPQKENKTNLNKSIVDNKIMLNSSYDELSGWEFSDANFYSTRFKRYTVTGVVFTLGAYIATLTSGPVGASAVAGLSAIAGTIVGDEIPIVYLGQNVWYKYITLDSGTKLPRAEKTQTYVYSDKNRTSQIGDTLYYEYYVSGYEPD